MKIMKTAVCAFAVLAALRSQASPVPASVIDGTAETCAALRTEDFSDIPDAMTEVTEAALVAETKGMVGYCEVAGYVAPNVGFLIRLPTNKWNEKFIQVGCGGSCGTFFSFLCASPLGRGYACITTDIGHKSTTVSGTWAYNNLQAEIDWSFRATHVVTLAGKAITERFYGRKPRLSYFQGCSTGGRQGTIEAQRFPWDFDGIIAGAPPFSESDTLMHILWGERSILDDKGRPILAAPKLRLVHDAALRQCDMDDDLADGIISNPEECRFDPEVLLCRQGTSKECLSESEMGAVRNFYSGPVTSSGRKLSRGGFARGSELEWESFAPGKSSYEKGRAVIARESLRYMGFMPDPPSTWSAGDFSYDIDYKRFGLMESLYGNTNPDLRRFKEAGGKLLIYHGWSDLEPSPLGSIDYYETVTKTMGGAERTREFFRLFLIPGMNHCSGGSGAFAIDYLTYLEKWVEKGDAPDVMIGGHVPSHKENYKAFADLRFPLDKSIEIAFTRPTYPYPIRARYKGSGDPNDATSFAPDPRATQERP